MSDDHCYIVEVDGESQRVRGYGHPPTTAERKALAHVIRAARFLLAAEGSNDPLWGQKQAAKIAEARRRAGLGTDDQRR